MSKCPSDKEMIESLLQESADLHHLLQDARAQACILLSCYISACASYEECRPEYLLASIANKDPQIFRFKSLEEIPEDYKQNSKELMKIVDHYAEDGLSVLDAAETIFTWPHFNKHIH